MAVVRSRSTDDDPSPAVLRFSPLRDPGLLLPPAASELPLDHHQSHTDAATAASSPSGVSGAVLSPAHRFLGEHCRGGNLPQSPLGGKFRRRHRPPGAHEILFRADSPPAAGSPLSRAVHTQSPLARTRISSPRTQSPRIFPGSPRATVPFKAAHHHHARNARPAHALFVPDNPLLAEIFSPHSASAGPWARAFAESSRASVTPRETARPLPADFSAARIPGETPPSLACDIPPTFWELPRARDEPPPKSIGVFARLSVLKQQPPPHPQPQQQGSLQGTQTEQCRSDDLSDGATSLKPGVIRRWRSFGRRSAGSGSSRRHTECHVDVEASGAGGSKSGASGRKSEFSGNSSIKETVRSRIDIGQPLRLVRSLSARVAERIEGRTVRETGNGGLDPDNVVTCRGMPIPRHEAEAKRERGNRRGKRVSKSGPLTPSRRTGGEVRQGKQGQGFEGGEKVGCSGTRETLAGAVDGIGCGCRYCSDAVPASAAGDASAALHQEFGVNEEVMAVIGGEEEEACQSGSSFLSLVAAAVQGAGRLDDADETVASYCRT
ncbi:unnamed protein product [Closterium sp. Naga37s-1]|nr:unnamed protein product [Closterium sp. Naga37s-1]